LKSDLSQIPLRFWKISYTGIYHEGPHCAHLSRGSYLCPFNRHPSNNPNLRLGRFEQCKGHILHHNRIRQQPCACQISPR
jgi:hypothetical protein